MITKRRYRKAGKLLALLLTALLLVPTVPVPVSAATSAEIQKEIDVLEERNKEIQKEIDAIQSLYDDNFEDMESIVAQKDAIDREMTLLSEKIITTNEQITAYALLIAETQKQLDDAEEALRTLSEEHRLRIRAMEEGGGISYWQVIFQANSFTDLLDRITMVAEIDAADRRRIDEMRTAADIVTATREGLETEKGNLELARKQLAEDEDRLEEKRKESDELLLELEKKSEEYAIMLAESEALQDDLMEEIAAAEARYEDAKHDEYLAELAKQGQNPKSDAKWVTPVTGYRLTSPFGMRLHPILGYNRMHNGIDMACATGTPIYATRAGKVTRAAYQAGGAGNYVSINHLDGFASIYMHMTNYIVSVGQTVKQGEVIGYVGSTGGSTGPHLHFGISYAGTYVNPLAYIY